MNIILMTVAFMIMLGVALLYRSLFRISVGEGTLLSASTIIALMFLGGAGGFFRPVTALIAVLAVLGVLSCAITGRKGESVKKGQLFSPYFLALFAVFVFASAAYYQDCIQRVDEFRQWALSIKFMLQENRLPSYSAILDARQPYAAALFCLFFQEVTGYSEANMYAASFLLMWIGFLLPFADCRRQRRSDVALYIAVVFLSLFSLYLYGSKNLYADLPLAAWAGGLAGWWMNRGRKKTDPLVAAAGLLTMAFFKAAVGPLMAVFVLLFMLAQTLVAEKGLLDRKKRRMPVLGACIFAAIAVSAAGIAVIYTLAQPAVQASLPAAAQQHLQEVGFSAEKIRPTFSALLTDVFGSPLGKDSNLKISYILFLAILMVLMKIASDLYDEKKRLYLYITYAAGVSVFYFAFLAVMFLFSCGYEESIAVKGVEPYLSICAIYLFVITLSWLFQEKRAEGMTAPAYLAMGLVVFFVLGMNQKFIPGVTSMASYKVEGYETMAEARRQIDCMMPVITQEDKVYLLDQGDNRELVTGIALYYLEDRVSNYMETPWKFKIQGSYVYQDTSAYTLRDFPSLLAQGGYTYLWIYEADKYLYSTLPKFLPCDELEEGALYRIRYKNGAAVGLVQAAAFCEQPEETDAQEG